MDRKTYLANKYARYWIKARDDIYGFMPYDKNLCKYVCENIPASSKILEVAVGTGYPFADYFQKYGFKVFGIDISPLLIEKCKQLNPEIKCKVGDAESLDYENGSFDCTYCFHSTWYFPDLKKVIAEMLRVTRSGGLIIFDIQNRHNPEIEKSFRKHVFHTKGAGRIIRYGKNVAKIVLRRGIPRWGSTIWEIPTYAEDVYKYLDSNKLVSYQVFVRMPDDSLLIQASRDSLSQFQRLVFAIKLTA